MRYSLHDFYLILDDLFLTAVHPLQDAVRDLGPSFYTFYMSPSLAAVLAWRYRQADLLVAIDAEEGNWRLSSARDGGRSAGRGCGAVRRALLAFVRSGCCARCWRMGLRGGRVAG